MVALRFNPLFYEVPTYTLTADPKTGMGKVF